MQNLTCSTCSKSKTPHNCGICHQAICKQCTHFVDGDTFAFAVTPPPHLKLGLYCSPCFDHIVVPEIEKYEQTVESAKQIVVYGKNQGKETRFFRRAQETYEVVTCEDRSEVVIRLAFMAVVANYNAIIDVNITSVKVTDGSYQKQVWSGTAKPANVNTSKLNQPSFQSW
jgi:hypothetical protein